MGDHDTWFSYLLPNYEGLLARFREALGVSFLNQTPIQIQYVIGYVFIALVLLVLAVLARRKIKDTVGALIPADKLNLHTLLEMIIEGTLGTMEAVMDRKTAIYFLPLVGTCALVILISNLLGLIPGFLPPTSNLSTTAAMASVIFVTTHVYGVKEHGFFKYFAHWMGPIRKWYMLPIMILMFLIEVISHVARPLSLSIRLMGNMFADHAVVGVFTGLIPILVPVPMLLMGVLVCIVQTLVFCVLSTVYIGGAVAHEEH